MRDEAQDPTAGTFFRQNNPWGGPVTVSKPATGQYQIGVPGGAAGFELGTVQVTAEGTAGHCNIFNWTDTTIDIDCWDWAGNQADMDFEVLRVGSTDDAYLWASDPAPNGVFTPSTLHSHNPQGTDPTYERTATGRYTVNVPGLKVGYGGLVNVTAYGVGSSHKCAVQDWLDETATVVCTDTVCGYDGDDFLVAQDGRDQLLGGDGEDTVSGNAGDDIGDGGNGNDTVFAGSGDDIVFGGPGDDLLGGSSGFDRIFGSSGADRISGGSDTDGEIWGQDGDDAVNGGGGDDDDVLGGPGNDTVSGNGGDDEIDGGEGNDEVRGGPGDDVVLGGPGDDFVAGNTGVDTCDGGLGSEVAGDTAAVNCETILNVP